VIFPKYLLVCVWCRQVYDRIFLFIDFKIICFFSHKGPPMIEAASVQSAYYGYKGVLECLFEKEPKANVILFVLHITQTKTKIISFLL